MKLLWKEGWDRILNNNNTDFIYLVYIALGRCACDHEPLVGKTAHIHLSLDSRSVEGCTKTHSWFDPSASLSSSLSSDVSITNSGLSSLHTKVSKSSGELFTPFSSLDDQMLSKIAFPLWALSFPLVTFTLSDMECKEGNNINHGVIVPKCYREMGTICHEDVILQHPHDKSHVKLGQNYNPRELVYILSTCLLLDNL